jgi:hypothetical protein
MWLGRRLEELAAGRVGPESHLVSHPDFHILNRAECWGLNAYDCDLHVYWWASLHSKCQEISGKLLPFSPLVGCFHFDLVLLGATFEISKHLWRSSQSDLPRPTKELMQKGYGIGSGISLFIATNICERRLDRYLRKMKRWPWKWTTGSKDSEPYRQVHYGQCWDSHFFYVGLYLPNPSGKLFLISQQHSWLVHQSLPNWRQIIGWTMLYTV